MKKISNDQAIAELQKWFEFKRLNQAQIDSKEDTSAEIIGAIEDGRAVINDDGSIDLKLAWPIGSEKKVESLKFKGRLTRAEARSALHGVKASDGDARIDAYISALTGQPRNVINQLDSVDYSFCQAVALYFL